MRLTPRFVVFKNVFLAVGSLFLLVSSIFLGVSCAMFANASYFKKNGIMTEAVIEDIRGEDVWIRYSTDDGNFTGPLGYYSSSMHEGDAIPIHYDPENPGRIHADGSDALSVIFMATGLLLFMLLCCFLVWLFSRSKTGIAMQAVGNNPRFAPATGTYVDMMRVIATVLSTVLGAVGILVYSQSYGFMQLYTAPRQMGFIAASAILIGGASTSRCKISHVLIGTFLFQGVLTLGMPVANVLVPGSTISETLRILISNGIILYALTKSGGDLRG